MPSPDGKGKRADEEDYRAQWRVDSAFGGMSGAQGSGLLSWTLDSRCRASEWMAAVRQGLEAHRLEGETCRSLVLRSDNGAQPCSKKFVAFLASRSVQGEYTGYDAPDDNAFVERVIRTIKEEEVWLNSYESLAEAHQAIESYVNFYNHERIHQSLEYKTPNEVAAEHAQRHAA